MSTFNELIDFTRSTTGTYLDSVVYGAEVVTNGDFATDSDWIKTGNLTAISNGTATIGETAGNGSIRQEDALIAGKSYIVKFDITAVSSASAFLAFRNDEFSSVGSAVISFGSSLSVATYSKVFVATGSIVNFTVGGGNSSLTIANVSVKEVTGGQVSGTPLLRTAAINEPRLEYDASGNPLGLLIEEARTNLVTYSNELLSASWSGAALNVVSSIPSIAGGQCFKLSSGNPISDYWIQSEVASNGQTKSIWARTVSGTGTAHILGHNSVAATLVTLTEQWQRFSLPVNTSEIGGDHFYAVDFRGSNTLNEILVFGAQVEAGSFPTSYIPTSGFTVTRNKDVVSVPVERFGYNTSQATVIVYGKSFLPSSSTYLWEIGAGSADRNFAKAYNQQSLYVIANSVNTVNLNAGTFTANSYGKLASTLKASSFAASFNGESAVVDNTGAVQLDLPAITIGQSRTNDEHLNGHIKQIQYYPKRLSNEELELLTQPSASPTMNLTFDGQATSTLVEGLHD